MKPGHAATSLSLHVLVVGSKCSALPSIGISHLVGGGRSCSFVN